MNTSNIKYSLIIPTRNSLNYVLDCINSVLSQEFDRFELIVSDNHSSDGTFEAVQSIQSKHLQLIRPLEYMPMVDHWEWALSHARGEWIIFLGSDDGVMPYFFRLAETLTSIANQHDIKVIGSARAYFFWPGCQNNFGSLALQYRAHPSYSIRSTRWTLINALVGTQIYFDIPHMYTSSLINHSLVNRAKEKQGGIFFSAQTPDASGAAVICSLADRYINCAIPLGWVGTSPKSNGMIYSNNRDEYQTAYFKNMLSKNVRWNEAMGAFTPPDNDRTINNSRAFLFEAILQAHAVINYRWNRIYQSRLFKALLFSRLLYVIHDYKDRDIQKQNLKDILTIHKIPFTLICLLLPLSFIIHMFRVFPALIRRWYGINGLSCKRFYQGNESLALMDASAIIDAADKQRNFIETFTKKFQP